jgi:hypothetical protein
MANDCCKPVICGGNPCGVSVTNTAACESLPSQIQNFTDQFFGVVVKTEVDGVVTWSLPCGLDVGLTNNPRLDGEGLACYFLRLFEDGIIGLTGPQGNPGVDGADGRNAYTVTLAGFIQPTPAVPFLQLPVSYNPAILAGMNVFVGGSGWYTVNENNPSGVLFLTLLLGLDGVSGVISAGKLVVPSGFQGAPGLTGAEGPQGPQGPEGEAFSTAVGFFVGSGADYSLTGGFAIVNFGGSDVIITLPEAGTYVLTASVGLVGAPGAATSDVVNLKLRNDTLGADVTGSLKTRNFLVDTQRDQVILHAITTATVDNTQLSLVGFATSPGVIHVVSSETTVSFVRVA